MTFKDRAEIAEILTCAAAEAKAAGMWHLWDVLEHAVLHTLDPLLPPPSSEDDDGPTYYGFDP